MKSDAGVNYVVKLFILHRVVKARPLDIICLIPEL